MELFLNSLCIPSCRAKKCFTSNLLYTAKGSLRDVLIAHACAGDDNVMERTTVYLEK
jgi:hypothetical protein